MVNRISENGQDILETAKSTAKSVQSAHLAGLGVGRIGPPGTIDHRNSRFDAEKTTLRPGDPPIQRPGAPASTSQPIQEIKSFWCRREELTVRRSGLHGPANIRTKKFLVPKRGLEPPRAKAHYPLKVACLPISPLRHKKLLILRND